MGWFWVVKCARGEVLGGEVCGEVLGGEVCGEVLGGE